MGEREIPVASPPEIEAVPEAPVHRGGGAPRLREHEGDQQRHGPPLRGRVEQKPRGAAVAGPGGGARPDGMDRRREPEHEQQAGHEDERTMGDRPRRIRAKAHGGPPTFSGPPGRSGSSTSRIVSCAWDTTPSPTDPIDEEGADHPEDHDRSGEPVRDGPGGWRRARGPGSRVDVDGRQRLLQTLSGNDP